MAVSEGKRKVAGSATRAKARRAMAAVVLVGAVAGVTACGDADTTTSVTGKAGDTLTIGTVINPGTLDPAVGTTSQPDFSPWAYDPLITWAPDGSAKPGLATSWSYGPNNESFTLKLRPNVKFSDGTPLDADAVKTYITYATKLPGAPAFLKDLETIDVASPTELTLRFSAPTPLLEKLLSQAFSLGLIANPKAVKAKTLANTTAGAGPYMLDKARTVTGDHYTYVPNPNYWNKPAVHWKKVVVKVMTNPTAALQALKTRQIQIAASQPVTSVAAAKAAGLKHEAPLVLYLGLSLMDREGKLAKPLKDVRVRQAINYAIDREAITKVIGAGFGRPLGQMAVPGDDSYDESLDKTYSYNPEKAKQLLAEAGYADGFTLPALVWTGNNLGTMAQAMAGQLSKVGIKLKLDIKPDVNDYLKVMGSAKAPTATIVFGRLPAAVEYGILWGPNASLFNPFKSKSPEIEKLNAQLFAASAQDAPGYAKQIQKVLVDQAWFAPVTAVPLVALHRPEVTGIAETPERNVYNAPEIKPAGGS
jgi:peptide/nickel transport system substrate-binding protein